MSKFETEGQLAGVLAHEIGHVVARHSAQRIAKEQLTQGITGAVLVAAGGGGGEAQLAQLIGSMVNMKYGRKDELQSDTLGVRFMSQAGYDPPAMIGVQEILAREADGSAPPESSARIRARRTASRRSRRRSRSLSGGVPAGLQP